eukprot:6178213-Pleurochrysis_carterae.AAC.1
MRRLHSLGWTGRRVGRLLQNGMLRRVYAPVSPLSAMASARKCDSGSDASDLARDRAACPRSWTLSARRDRARASCQQPSRRAPGGCCGAHAQPETE